MNTTSRIEPLESRIALTVTLLAGGRALTYDDGDGDRVTVAISKGTLALSNFDFGPAATGIPNREQLEAINLAGLTQFDGATLSITAVPTAGGGDGTVSVGHINAAGIDLGVVLVRGDLGAIDAGDGTLTDGGVRSLTVLSLGGEGLATGAPDLVSDIHGSVGSIRVVSDIAGAQISITGANAALGSLSVGGSILGDTAADSGVVSVPGTITTVAIGGDLFGNAGAGSGSISAGRIGTVRIGGTIYGGAGADSGQIFTAGLITSIIIGGDLLGGDGEASGLISADSLGTVALDGSIFGGLGEASGRIESGGNLTTLRVGGSLIGGSLLGVGNEKSGSIFVAERLGSAVISGNVRGGDSEATFVNQETGYIEARNIGTLILGGSLFGGSDEGGGLFDSGTIRAIETIGNLVIKGGIFGGSSSSGGTTNGSGYVEANRILAMTVGGSLLAGDDAASGLANSGAIRALKDIGALAVRGSLEGTLTHPVVISAVGQPVPSSATDLAMRSVTVYGRVFRAEILAGYGADTSSSVLGNALNADAQIGAVRVGGDWIASDLIAGLSTGGDAFFGDENDVKIAGIGVTDSALRISRIASIVIGGRVLGTAAVDGERFGFGAQFIGSMKVGGVTAIPLFAGAGNDRFNNVGLYALGQTRGTANLDGYDVHAFEVAVP